MAEVVMKTGLRAALLRGVGGIKVDRNKVDIEAIKQSVGVLKDGRVLIIFPQGGIVADDEIDALKSGAALMALQAGVPIVPMHIRPRAHWYSRQQVVIGETVDPAAICPKKMPSTADIGRITEALMAEMNRCAAGTQTVKEKEHEHV